MRVDDINIITHFLPSAISATNRPDTPRLDFFKFLPYDPVDLFHFTFRNPKLIVYQ